MNVQRDRFVIVFGSLVFMLTQTVHASSDHLEPISPYDPTGVGYDQTVFASLVGKAWASLWMIEKPSFSREYAVVLRSKIECDPNDIRSDSDSSRGAKHKQWCIEYVAPRKRIWAWIPAGPGIEQLHVVPTEDVERHSVPIAKEFAQSLQECWVNVLELTRYGESPAVGPDGTNVQFYCDGLFGEVWSPNTGLPAMLVDLGRKLRTLALSDDEGRNLMLIEIDSLARKISKEAEAEQMRVFGKRLCRRLGALTREAQHGE